MSSKHQNRNFTVEQENIGSILFLSVKICRKMTNLSQVFSENQYLLEFSPAIKVSFQRTKREDFYTEYIGILVYMT